MKLSTPTPDRGWSRALRTHAREWVVLGGAFSPAMLLSTALIALALLTPMLLFRLERDQAHFAYFADLWLHGVTPYVDVHAHQWPGQYLLYLVALKLFGVNDLAIRIEDIGLQSACAVALAMLTGRSSRPILGLVAAIVYTTGYVLIGPWSTANRETYQAALLFPVLYWALYAQLPRSLDRACAVLSGAIVALIVLVKPTAALVVLPLGAMLVVRAGLPKTESPPRERLLLALAGGAGLVSILAWMYRGHFAAVFDSLVSFNRELYAKLSTPPEMRRALPGALLTRGLPFLPAACLLLPASRRRPALWLLVTELTLVGSIVAQGKGLQYHFALLTPFSILAWLVCAHSLGERLVPCLRRVRSPARQSFAIALATLGAGLVMPGEDLVVPEQYLSTVRGWKGQPRGAFGPKWDAAAAWLRAHGDPTREKIYVFGADDGLQFLLRLPIVSATTTGILDLRTPELNFHPLILSRKRELLADLQRARPEWILVASFDESWLTRSGVDSIAAFPELGAMLRDEYTLKESGEYWFYRRR
ncbi:MAG: hypothetical protein ACHREM_05800 [Polyangiales bacterium]